MGSASGPVLPLRERDIACHRLFPPHAFLANEASHPFRCRARVGLSTKSRKICKRLVSGPVEEANRRSPLLRVPVVEHDNLVCTSHNGGSRATGTVQALFGRLFALTASTLLHDPYVIENEHWDMQEGV